MIRPRLVTNMLVACWFLLAFAAPTVQAQQGHGLPPMATPAAATVGEGWRIVDIQVLDYGATPVALSPDGQWIAGIDEEDRFCVWDVATLAPACIAEQQSIHPESIAWAPDSSAVAYALDAFRLLKDSDIFVFELDTGKSVNLTDDGVEEDLDPMSSEIVPVDVLPAWSADSQWLTFARSNFAAPEQGPDLMTIDRKGGEPERRFTVSDELGLAIGTPMFSLRDGSLLYAVTSGNLDHPDNGMWHLDASGEARQILPGLPTDAFPHPAIFDVVETESGIRISGASIRPNSLFDPTSFVLDLGSGELTPYHFAHAVVLLGPEASVTALPEPEEFAPDSFDLRRAPDWAANNTILVSGFSPGGYLITVEPAS